MKKHKIFGIGITIFIVSIILSINSNAKAFSCSMPDGSTKTYSSSLEHAKYKSDIAKYCSGWTTDDALKSYYDLKLIEIDEDTYKVKMGKNRKDEFKITDVSGNGSGVGGIIKYKYGKDEEKPVIKTSSTNVSVKLELVKAENRYRFCISNDNKATNRVPKCHKKDYMNVTSPITKVTIKLSQEKYGSVVTGHPKRATSLINQTHRDVSAKLASMSHDFGGHEREFADQPAGTRKSKNSSGRIAVGTLTCDYNSKATSRKANGDYNYITTKYFNAKENTGEVKYYHYGKTKNITVCKPTCTEKVKVEYGPPVAAEAGLCFEYQVRVTSYVQCEPNFIHQEEPDTADFEWCMPHPVNEVWDGRWEFQGGPTEDFDSCINSCDGGKYTAKCSRKCYKEVYGSSSSKSKLTFNSNRNSSGEIVQMKEINTPLNQTYYNVGMGCYYSGRNDWPESGTKPAHFVKEADGGVHWSGGKRGGSVARWYYAYGYHTVAPVLTYIADANGFCRATNCDEGMHWYGCKADKYTTARLDDRHTQYDYDQTVKNWRSAMLQCAKEVKCENHVSTYTITLTGQTDTPLKFPENSTGKDKLSYNNSKNTNNLKETTILTPNKKKIEYINNNKLNPTDPDRSSQATENSHSCYYKPVDGVWYQAEWSFPGRWIQNKPRKVQYHSPTQSNTLLSNWRYEPDKYCTKKTSANVNKAWFNYFVTGKKCPSDSSIFATGNFNYNIKFSTRKFGHFKWNIDVSCFYAVNNKSITYDSNGCPPSTTERVETKGSDKRYISFKVIDNKDPLPDSSNRSTGFNWTSDAKSTTKNTQYRVDPITLLENIKNRKDSIYNESYSNQYLDYKFVLTPKQIRQLRSYAEDHKMTEFNGDFKIVKGVLTYYSSILGNTNYVSTSKRATRGCNNNGSGSSCE
ncbi:MAG: hypothetical protein IJF92_03975 [Bacilli bacterium]|nr:hypothetical protein [Bacilli bacterium]